MIYDTVFILKVTVYSHISIIPHHLPFSLDFMSLFINLLNCAIKKKGVWKVQLKRIRKILNIHTYYIY